MMNDKTKEFYSFVFDHYKETLFFPTHRELKKVYSSTQTINNYMNRLIEHGLVVKKGRRYRLSKEEIKRALN